MKNVIHRIKKQLSLFFPIVLLFMPLFSQGQNVQAVEEKLLKEAEENIEKYRKGDVIVQFMDAKGNELQNTNIQIEQKTHDFLFGCIIFPLIWQEDVYRPELYKRRFQKIFNLAVFPFYWPAYESHQGRPEWQGHLPVLEWCHDNNITPKGHPLVWPCVTGLPEWLSRYSPEEITLLSESRVKNIAAGFRNDIQLFDIVNEPVNLKTWNNKVSDLNDRDDWGHKEPISEVADYVEDALNWGKTGNPEATFMINEYQTIANEDVRERYDKLITELKNRNAPLGGIGIQAHEPRQEWFPPEEVWETFDLYAKHDLPVHITEFHPQSSGVPITGGWRSGPWTSEAQTEFTEQFVKLCFGHPAVVSINWWGFSDRNIWLPGGGLLDEEYNPKPVYHMLDTLINQTWRTNMDMTTDNKGEVSFRGFYGTYKIMVSLPDGRIKAFPIHVRKDEENKWVFRVE